MPANRFVLPSLFVIVALISACGGDEPPVVEKTGPYAVGDTMSSMAGPGAYAETVSLADLDVTSERAKAIVLELAAELGKGADPSPETEFANLPGLLDEDGDLDDLLKSEVVSAIGRAFGLVATDERIEEMSTLADAVAWIESAKDAPRVLMVWASGCDTCTRVYNDKVNEAVAEQNARMLVVASHGYDTKKAIVERLDDTGLYWKVLLDQDQKVNARLDAEKTPTMYVLDAKGVLRYAGGVDNAPDVPRGDEELDDYLTDAIVAVREGREVEVKTAEAIGCPLRKKQ